MDLEPLFFLNFVSIINVYRKKLDFNDYLCIGPSFCLYKNMLAMSFNVLKNVVEKIHMYTSNTNY